MSEKLASDQPASEKPASGQPASGQPASEKPASDQPASEELEGEKLALVIEDDFDASVIFAKALEVNGFKTEIINSGDMAIERLKTVVPAIIVLDLHLPRVVGTDILVQIREDERLEGTRVIVATADPRTADIIQDKADLVLIKPTTYSQVRDFAARLTSRPRRQSRPRPSASDDGAPSAP